MAFHCWRSSSSFTVFGAGFSQLLVRFRTLPISTPASPDSSRLRTSQGNEPIVLAESHPDRKSQTAQTSSTLNLAESA